MGWGTPTGILGDGLGDGLKGAHNFRLYEMSGTPGSFTYSLLATGTIAAGTMGVGAEGWYAWGALNTPVVMQNGSTYWAQVDQVNINNGGWNQGDYHTANGAMNTLTETDTLLFSNFGDFVPGFGDWFQAGASSQNIKYAAIPSSTPTLSAALISTKITLSWPASATGFALNSTTNLATAMWTPVPETPQLAGTNLVVTNAVAPGSRFYRLQK